MQQRDAGAVRRLLTTYPEFRPFINAPFFPFNAPAIVACANDAAMIEVLLEFGANPNTRKEVHGGQVPLPPCTWPRARQPNDCSLPAPYTDACAAAHLDRPDLLAERRSRSGMPRDRAAVVTDRRRCQGLARSRAVVDPLLYAGAGDLNARAGRRSTQQHRPSRC